MRKSSPHTVGRMVLETLRDTAKGLATKSLEFIAFFHFSLREIVKNLISLSITTFIHNFTWVHTVASVLCEKVWPGFPFCVFVVLKLQQLPLFLLFRTWAPRAIYAEKLGDTLQCFLLAQVFFDPYLGMYLLRKACVFLKHCLINRQSRHLLHPMSTIAQYLVGTPLVPWFSSTSFSLWMAREGVKVLPVSLCFAFRFLPYETTQWTYLFLLVALKNP